MDSAPAFTECGGRSLFLWVRSTYPLLTTSLAGRLQGALDNGMAARNATRDLRPVDQLCELGDAEVNQAAALDGAVLTLGER
jgi:hypothetical protein